MTRTLAHHAWLALVALSLPFSVAVAADPDWQPIHIHGRVVDLFGHPIKGAMCFWVWSEKRGPGEELIKETVSDADGRFELIEHETPASNSGDRAGGTLWFLADGCAVRWQKYQNLPPISSNRRTLEIVLKPKQKITYCIVDPKGHPRLGELIEPMYLIGDRMMMPPPRPIRDLLSGTTDDDGMFSVDHLGVDQGVSVRVISEQFGTIEQQLSLSRAMSPVVTLQLRAAGQVEGSIELEHPERFAGRRVTLRTDRKQAGPYPVHGVVETTVDARGRFRAPLLAAGTLSVWIDTSADAEFRPLPIESVEVTAGRQADVTVPVIRTIPISGRVTDTEGGPLSGEGHVTLSNGGPYPELKLVIDPYGCFSGRTYPGPVDVRAECTKLGGVPVGSNTLVAHHSLDVDPKSPPIECPPIKLPKGKIITGQALDPDNQPLIGATIFVSFGKSSGAEFKTDTTGRFQYVVNESTPVGKYMLMRDERTLTPLDRTDDPLVIRMPPSNEAAARQLP